MSTRLDWFEAARYGLFIHWGAYAAAARGEWAMNRERIPQAEYLERYIKPWRAEQYDPGAWAALAQAAGMGYLVLTTRHHDGFSLWDTALSDFHAGNYGPRRDLVGPYVKAVRAAGLKVGLYYSPAAWTHPDYPGPFYRDWPSPQDWRDEASRQRFIAYYRGQIRELLTRYGRIDYLWFDGCIPENLDGAETLAMVRELQPDILVNNRLGKPFDIMCCEQAIHPAPAGQPWEACMTLNDSWGYHAGDSNWKNAAAVVQMLVTCAASGGNLLLNIGPRADGSVPEESVRILRDAGAWVNRHHECLSRSERHPFSWNSVAHPITCRGDRVYLHFFRQPGGCFCWGDLRNRCLGAWLLPERRPLAFRQEGDRLFLEGLPNPLPGNPIGTVKLQVEGPLQAITAQTSFWIPG